MEKPRQTRINVTMGEDTRDELLKRIPEKERSKFIESLIRKELGMEERPDYRVGRPKSENPELDQQ